MALVSAARRGFTIVELMIASLLFSMVIAAVSAIYATAFGQSGRAFGQSRTKLMATMSMKAIMRDVGQATYIQYPTQDTYGTILTGCTNAILNDAGTAVVDRVAKGTEETAKSLRFLFCVRTTNMSNGSPCDGNPDSAPCLFYYSQKVSGICPSFPSGFSSSSCGNSNSLGSATLLASGLEALSTLPANAYFSRRDTDFAQEDNAVRIAYNVTRPPGPNSPKLYFQVDTSASSHFGVRP